MREIFLLALCYVKMVCRTLVGALDKQDAWGAAVLEWLLGRPDQALHTLLSSPPAPLMSPQQTQVTLHFDLEVSLLTPTPRPVWHLRNLSVLLSVEQPLSKNTKRNYNEHRLDPLGLRERNCCSFYLL